MRNPQIVLSSQGGVHPTRGDALRDTQQEKSQPSTSQHKQRALQILLPTLLHLGSLAKGLSAAGGLSAGLEGV